jgi:hypothetical protein
MTEDWHKSLLYKNLKLAIPRTLPLTEQEMKVFARKPPKDLKSIQLILEKGIEVLKILLMEMLGTKEDMKRFHERFMTVSSSHLRALMEKCLSLVAVNKLTTSILIDIISRNNLIKSLKISNTQVKQKVVKVYKLNQIIRQKIFEWTQHESVPFNKFIFDGKDYIKKMAEDSVMLQEFLASPCVLYTSL